MAGWGLSPNFPGDTSTKAGPEAQTQPSAPMHLQNELATAFQEAQGCHSQFLPPEPSALKYI